MRLSILASLGFLVAGCSGAQLALPAISDADVARAKRAMDARAIQLAEYYRTDEEAASLVSAIGNTLKLAAARTCQRVDFSPCVFHVNYLPDDTVNAYADDTTVYIHRGFIRYLATEDEIAAVIGHEMGHVMAEHYVEAYQNSQVGAIIGGLLIGGLMAGSGYYSSPGYDPHTSQDILQGGMQLGAGIGRLSFSKEQEREADLISAYLLTDAGYDLTVAGRVFEVMTALDDGEVKAGLLDTHPAGPERLAAWSRAIADIQPGIPQTAASSSTAAPVESGQEPTAQEFSNSCTWNSVKYHYECWALKEPDVAVKGEFSALPDSQVPLASSQPNETSAEPGCVWNSQKYRFECW